jgi:exopolyphosphatase/guanosine-5'-triphosphate,3'-diphosphate pyrophosphatase
LPVAAVDIGSNSTRLLIADGTRELARGSVVTRLGEGVDAGGRLGDAPQQRVIDVLDGFRATIEAHGCERAAAVMTSAVRDAANGEAFAARVSETLGFEARILSGDEEARLTYDGATFGRDGAFLVIDIGGGSTELVLGTNFHVSTQIGVVRHSERHLHSDPPTAAQVDALTQDVRRTLEAHVPVRIREQKPSAIAVAGTPTQCAAIDLGLERYDPARVEGHVLSATRLGELLDRLAPLPLAQLGQVTGLDRARAPVIVAGIAILLEVVRWFDLHQVEASERDILWGLTRSTTGGF